MIFAGIGYLFQENHVYSQPKRAKYRITLVIAGSLLDKASQELISNYLKNKVLRCTHPEDLGKPMQYDYVGLWRYRVGKYRVICSIEEELLIVLVLRIAIRDEMYTQII